MGIYNDKDLFMNHFKFEEQQKQFDEVLDRTQSMYEFWIKATFTTIKDLFKVK